VGRWSVRERGREREGVREREVEEEREGGRGKERETSHCANIFDTLFKVP
jgi:hypothetical protein